LNYVEILKENHPFRELNEIHQEALANQEVGVRKDIRIPKIEGGYRDVFIQCKASVNAESKMVLTGIMQDITERKKSEEELLKSQEKYQDFFNKSKDPMIYKRRNFKYQYP